MNDSIKLVAFDLDGVLIDEPGSWMQVHKALGTQDKAHQHACAFFNGKISFEDWARKDVALWNGTRISKINDILYGIPLMDGVSETLSELKDMGFKIAIITGGLKTLADRIRKTHNLDYSIGNELTTRDGKIIGVKKDVDFYSKGRILSEIASQEGITTSQCACIGDHVNDIPMFKLAGLSIAFNPKDEELRKHADYVIEEKKIRDIIAYLTEQPCTSPAQT